MSTSKHLAHAVLVCTLSLISVAPAVAEPDGSSGHIRGRVRDAATGLALVGADVNLFSSGGALLAATTAEIGGRYEFFVSAPGNFFVTAGVASLQSEVWNGIPCSNCDPTSGAPIQVASGGVAEGINFDLEALGSISGTVTEAATGNPIPFAQVEVIELPGTMSQSSITDENGQYHVEFLRFGTYVVWVYSPSFVHELYNDVPCMNLSCPLADGDPVQVLPATDTPGINFALEPLGRIVGEVRELGSGAPIPNARVSLFLSTGAFSGDFFADSAGVFEVGAPAGSYFLVAQPFLYLPELYADQACPGGPPAGCDPLDGTPITVTTGGTTTGIHFDLQSLGRITGRVTDSVTGAGIPGSFTGIVTVFDSAGTFVGSAIPDAGGAYALLALPASTYFVVAAESGYRAELWNGIPCGNGPPEGCDVTTGNAVAVTLGSTTAGIDLALEPFGAIEGAVRDEFTSAPLAFASVWLYTSEGQLLTAFGTDFLGRYRTPRLPAGSYFLGVDTPAEYVAELYQDIPCPDGLQFCNPLTGTPVSVSLATVTGDVDFDLAFRQGIQGTVRDHANQTPVAGVAIDIFRDSGSLAGSTSTLANGRYQIALFPDTYYVATDNGRGGLDEVFNARPCTEGPAFQGECNPLLGDAITIQPAGPAVSGIDFNLSMQPIFEDDFESGDASAWSLVVP